MIAEGLVPRMDSAACGDHASGALCLMPNLYHPNFAV